MVKAHLVIKINEINNLSPPAECNFFIEIKVGSKRVRTTHRNSIHPIFQDLFYIEVDEDVNTFDIALWNAEYFDVFVGIKTLPFIETKECSMWYILKPQNGSDTNCGNIHITYCIKLKGSISVDHIKTDLKNQITDCMSKKITYVDLSYSHISSFPPPLKDKFTEASFLNMGNNPLKEYPNLMGLTKLEGIALNFSQIKDFVNIITAPELVSLYFKGISMTDVPGGIFQLRRLKKLDLSQNDLHIIPNNLGFLGQLEFLDVSNNPISMLPVTIGNMKSLSFLRAHHCNIKILPSELSHCSKLIEIDVSFNKILAIPDTYGNLTQLKRFLINNNELNTIPASLWFCKSLYKTNSLFTLESNQFDDLLLSVIQGGPSAILPYLENEVKNKNIDSAPTISLPSMEEVNRLQYMNIRENVSQTPFLSPFGNNLLVGETPKQIPSNPIINSEMRIIKENSTQMFQKICNLVSEMKTKVQKATKLSELITIGENINTIPEELEKMLKYGDFKVRFKEIPGNKSSEERLKLTLRYAFNQIEGIVTNVNALVSTSSDMYSLKLFENCFESIIKSLENAC